MAEEEKEFPMKLPYRSSDERWKARFHGYYEGMKNLHLGYEIRPTQEDIEAFQKARPVDGEKLSAMLSQGKFNHYGTAVGGVAATLQCMRWTRNIPLLSVSAFITTVASYYISDDIGKWIYGTFKFDQNAVNRSFLLYVRDERRIPETSANHPDIPPSH